MKLIAYVKTTDLNDTLAEAKKEKVRKELKKQFTNAEIAVLDAEATHVEVITYD